MYTIPSLVDSSRSHISHGAAQASLYLGFVCNLLLRTRKGNIINLNKSIIIQIPIIVWILSRVIYNEMIIQCEHINSVKPHVSFWQLPRTLFLCPSITYNIFPKKKTQTYKSHTEEPR